MLEPLKEISETSLWYALVQVKTVKAFYSKISFDKSITEEKIIPEVK